MVIMCRSTYGTKWLWYENDFHYGTKWLWYEMTIIRIFYHNCVNDKLRYRHLNSPLVATSADAVPSSY